MKAKLVDFLDCPRCRKGELKVQKIDQMEAGEILSGELSCKTCRSNYPIIRGIPRFVEASNYASSFGFQWNTFQKEQLDSSTRASLSKKRLLTETGWSPEWFKGKWILDAGCGAGRFLEIAADLGAEIVGVDLSQSVDGVRIGLGDRPNLHLIQGSIFDLPLKANVFDACYCIGVLQHTPDPLRATAALPRILKAKGKLAVTIYENRRWTKLHSKYWLRPLTRKLPHRLLLGLISFSMPILFPLTNLLFRLPLIGRVFRFSIPVANYVELDKELSLKDRYQLSVLDTFDVLAPAYDLPQTEADVRKTFQEAGLHSIERLPNSGLNLIGEKEQNL